MDWWENIKSKFTSAAQPAVQPINDTLPAPEDLGMSKEPAGMTSGGGRRRKTRKSSKKSRKTRRR